MRFTDNAELTTANMANADILAGTDVSADTDKKFTLEGLAKWIIEYYNGSTLGGSAQTVKSAIDNGGGGGGSTSTSWVFSLADNEIASGTNLNTLTSIGSYRSSGSAISSALTNSPISDQGFVMRVMYGATSNHLHQLIISAKGDKMYIRRIGSGSGVTPEPWTDISGGIPVPVSASAGDFLVYNGTAWTAQSLSTWQGGNY